MTTSARSPLTRQYSCALRSWRAERQRVSLSDPEEHDRKIAGDAIAPQILLTENVAGEIAGADARGVGSKRARCEAIEEHGLLITESQVLQGDVHVSECHRERARCGGSVTILSRQRQRGGTIRRNARGKRDTDDGARGKSDPLAKCTDRIEDRAGRARERPAVQDNRD